MPKFMVTIVLADVIEAEDREEAEDFGNAVLDGEVDFSWPAGTVIVEPMQAADAEAA